MLLRKLKLLLILLLMLLPRLTAVFFLLETTALHNQLLLLLKMKLLNSLSLGAVFTATDTAAQSDVTDVPAAVLFPLWLS